VNHVELLGAGAVAELSAAHLLGSTTSVAVALAGYALLCAFGLSNRLHPGMLLVTAGLLANATVILADAGMPVAGVPAGASSGYHHGLRPGDHLTALADVIPVTSERLSPGDVVLSAGGAVSLFTWVPPVRRRRLA
jgi:hypothetical protein